MQQQQYRGHRRHSRRKPSFWRAHRTLSIALLSSISAAAVAAASVGIYEHRLAAERIGVASRGTLVPMVPPGKTYVEPTQTKVATNLLGLPSYQGKRGPYANSAPSNAGTPKTSNQSMTDSSKQPDAVSTSDGLPSDGVKTGGGSYGGSSIAMDTGSAPVQSGGFSGGSGYQNFGGGSSGYGSGGSNPPTSPANYQPPAGPGSPGPGPSAQPPYVPPTGPNTQPGPIAQPNPPTTPPVAQNPPPSNPIVNPPSAPPSSPIISPQSPPSPTVVASTTPPPGGSPDNPVRPQNPSSPVLQLPIPSNTNGWTYFDPVVAVGYNYQLQASDPSSALTFGITDIRVTTKVGDGQYQLWLFDVLTGQYVNVGQEIDADADGDFNVVAYLDTFDAAQDAEFGITDPNDGLTQFSLRGIDPNANLDPNDPDEFITGLMFEGTINGNLFITPLTLDTDVANAQDPNGNTFEVALPEPGTLSVFGLGLAGMALLRRRRRRAA